MRDDRPQRVCMELVRLVGLDDFWTEKGPSQRCHDLFNQGHRKGDREQQVVLSVAWSVWNERGSATFHELFHALRPSTLRRVGSLLVAMSDGGLFGDAVGEWLQGNEGVTTRDRLIALREQAIARHAPDDNI